MVKHTQTIRRKIAGELSVFDHFVGLALKGLSQLWTMLCGLTPLSKQLLFKVSEKGQFVKST